MILTASQLYDLALDLNKARKQPTKTGPRGGRFYLTQSGEKVYAGEGKTEPPLLLHTVSSPHLSGSHQNIDVQIVPGKKQLPANLQQKMRVRPPSSMTDRSSRRGYIQAQLSSNWPAYFCRNCKSAIVPNHDHPVTVKRAIKNPRTGEIEGRVEETVGHTTDVMKVHSGTGKKEWIESPEPSAVAQRLCPSCFKKNEVLSTEVIGHYPAPKMTREERRVLEQEKKAADKALKVAMKKPEHFRTPEEKKMVNEYEAVQGAKEKSEKERYKKERSTSYRREYESSHLEKEESKSQDKLRQKYKDHLISQGTTETDAENLSQALTKDDLARFRDKISREEYHRRESTRQKMGKELAGKRIARIVGLGELTDLMERRYRGVPGSEKEHGLTEEGLSPSYARQVEEVRTRRLRERKAEAEKKKTHKSFGLWVSL